MLLQYNLLKKKKPTTSGRTFFLLWTITTMLFYNPHMTRTRLQSARLCLVAGIWLTLLAAGCRGPALLVELSPGLEDEWKALIERTPPPEPLRVTAVQAGKHTHIPHLQLVKVQGPPRVTPAQIIIARHYVAPVAFIWEQPATLPEFSAETRASGRYKTVTDIRFPERALPVQGMRVGDRDYPLQETLILRPAVQETTEDKKSPSGTGLSKKQTRALEKWLRSLEAAQPEETRRFVIGAVGDIMPARGVTEILLSRKGPERVFTDVLDHMRTADLLVGNLEGPASVLGQAETKSFAFRFSPKVLGPLKEAGFDYLSLANNHSFDFGEQAFVDSLGQLALYGIGTSGAGRSPQEAARPWIYREAAAGREIRILSMSAWPREKNGFDGVASTAVRPDRPGVLWAGDGSGEHQERAFQAIRDAFSQESYNIILIHGGEEWSVRPDKSQRDLYRRLCDLGADLVLGAHPHVLHGMESVNGSLIAHSLGNFVFPGMDETRYGEHSMLLLVSLINGRPVYLDTVPVRINNTVLSVDTGGGILERFLTETERLHQQ